MCRWLLAQHNLEIFLMNVAWPAEKHFCLNQNPIGKIMEFSLMNVLTNWLKATIGTNRKCCSLLPLLMVCASSSLFYRRKWENFDSQSYWLPGFSPRGIMTNISLVSNSKMILVDARRRPSTMHDRSKKVSCRKVPRQSDRSRHRQSMAGPLP